MRYLIILLLTILASCAEPNHAQQGSVEITAHMKCTGLGYSHGTDDYKVCRNKYQGKESPYSNCFEERTKYGEVAYNKCKNTSKTELYSSLPPIKTNTTSPVRRNAAPEKSGTEKVMADIEEICVEETKTKKPPLFANYINCKAERSMKFYESTNGRNTDVFRLFFAKLKVLAEKVDKRKITSSEYEVGAAEAGVELNNTLNLRTEPQSRSYIAPQQPIHIYQAPPRPAFNEGHVMQCAGIATMGGKNSFQAIEDCRRSLHGY